MVYNIYRMVFVRENIHSNFAGYATILRFPFFRDVLIKIIAFITKKD